MIYINVYHIYQNKEERKRERMNFYYIAIMNSN